MPTAKLTARGVEALETDKVQEEFWDELLPGFGLRVGRGGTKTYVVRYRANGRYRRHTLGRHPRLSLAGARKKARSALAAAEDGSDPAQEREDRKKGRTTFRAMAEEVLEAKAERTRERTRRERRRLLRKELLPTWGDREASSITRREVVQLVEGIVRRGAPTVANRTLSVIRLLFNDGIRRGFPGVEANPAHLVEPPGEETGRHRYLRRHEIRAVWTALEDETVATRCGFRLALLTAQRIGSVCAMQWDLLDSGLWRIPPTAFKGKRVHLVPLSPEAQEILAELRELRASDEWVFPSRAGSRRPHVTNLAGSLARVREATGIPHWTVHDFRTTFRTHATRAPAEGGLGVGGPVADAVLGHKEATLGFARYTGDQDRYLLQEKREALEAWGSFVRKALEETP